MISNDLNVKQLADAYLNSLPDAKRDDVQLLQNLIVNVMPAAMLWFDDGKDENGKTVTNPTIGYGYQKLKYANGSEKEFFQVGISANKSGISVYILGLPDKNYLPQTYGSTIGKANVTGYCIKFNKLTDINTNMLKDAITAGVKITS